MDGQREGKGEGNGNWQDRNGVRNVKDIQCSGGGETQKCS